SSVKEQVEPGQICVVRGTLDDRGSGNIIAREIVSFQSLQERNFPYVKIVLDGTLLPQECVKNFIRSLKDFPGRSQVLLEIRNGIGSVTILLAGIKVDGPTIKMKGLSSVIPEESYEICC
ncbi:MAG: DNA polymerase III subunit alpha, partial [Aminobacterium sp.]|nr:DNA polymerase III subunit alpha [Aminobacterium sp.]